MIHIDNAAIAKLRDRLLETGGPPSVLVTGPEALHRATHPMAGDEEAIALFQAVFEVMFLMVCADGNVSQVERDLLRGAIRELTHGEMRSAEIDEMATACEARLREEGVERRLAAASVVLRAERMAAEAAFVLSAAMAFADDEIADEENELLNELAEQLGIDPDRANELIDELETAPA